MHFVQLVRVLKFIRMNEVHRATWICRGYRIFRVVRTVLTTAPRSLAMTSAVRPIGSSSILGLATTAAATAGQDLGDEEEGAKVRHVDGCEWEYLSVSVCTRESFV
jgi:hypothetical protein